MNMSYCRFSNTSSDFNDCAEHIYSLDPEDTSYNNMDEIRARARLISVAYYLIEELGGSIDVSVEELKKTAMDGYVEPIDDES